MEQTKTEIKQVNDKFRNLHGQLLKQGLFKIADEFSAVYYEAQGLNYKAGIDFVTELNKKY